MIRRIEINSRSMSYLRWPAMALAGICSAAGFIGCSGKPRVEFGTVHGIVRVNGHPQRRAMIQFSPDGAKGNVAPVFANGTSDDQGNYTLKYSYQDKIGEGAPVGWNRVMLIDTTVGVTPQGQEPKPPAIPLSYSMPSSTPLRFEVKPGDNTIDLEVKK